MEMSWSSKIFFDSLQFKFESCSIINEEPPDISEYLWPSPEVYQAKTLFYYNGQSNVEFVENAFTNWNSAVGLIYVVKNSDYSGLLIDGNTFENSSALFGANSIRLDILQSKNYTDTLSDYMPWAGVQISNNQFIHNVGWLNTYGNILSTCGLEADLQSNIENERSYSEIYISNIDVNLITLPDEIANFTTENISSMNEGDITIDLNLFLMGNNIFDENFIPNIYGLVNFINIFKISIKNEIYQNNGFMFKEALNTYGCIYSETNENTADSGAFKFSGYFLENEGFDKSDSVTSQIYYSGPPIFIQYALYIDIYGIFFDNNYIIEVQIESESMNVVKPAQTISIVFSKGTVTIGKCITFHKQKLISLLF